MTPTRLFLLRHGAVAPEVQGRFIGHTDVPLAAAGHAQYERLRQRLAPEPVRAVYSSDLQRCREGAELLAAAHGLTTELRPALRELHFGAWEGRSWAEVEAEYPGQCQARLADPAGYQMPGGESLADLLARLLPLREEILRRHAGETVVLVAHGGVNRALLLDALGAPPARLFHLEQRYGCYNLLHYHADGLGVVQQVNRLPGEDATDD